MPILEDILQNESFRMLVNHGISQFVAMSLTILLIPNLRVTSVFGAAWVLGGIALLNAVFWSGHLFLSIPTSFSLYALELILMNGFLFWLLVKLLPGIETSGFLPAIAAPIVFSVVSGLLYVYAGSLDWIAFVGLIFDQLIQLKQYFMQHSQKAQ